MHILPGSRLRTIPIIPTWSDSYSFQTTVGCLGILKFQNSNFVPSRKPFPLVFFYLRFPLCLIGQRSRFETVQFSTALISKSQVETWPAEGLLDSLSHSSLTHKQLVTYSAFFFFTCQTLLSLSAQLNTHTASFSNHSLMQIDKLDSPTNRADTRDPQSVS